MDGKTLGIIFFLLIVVGAGGFYVGNKYRLVPTSTPLTPVMSTTPAGSSQMSPQATTSPTAKPTVDESETIKAAVMAALVAEHGSGAQSLTIIVSKIIGAYAQGGASESGGGAMWLAAKVNGQWKLVWDGNGTISCTSLAPYPEYPVSLAPECWNEQSQTIKKR